MKRELTLSVRLSERELSMLQALAKDAGVTMSEWVREMVRGRALDPVAVAVSKEHAFLNADGRERIGANVAPWSEASPPSLISPVRHK